MCTFQSGDGNISYEEYAPQNPGEIVLMVPGIGDLRHEYRLIAPILAEAGLRPVSMDLRGMGESSVGWREYTPEAVGRDMLALGAYFGEAPVWLMGCSMAAASAVWAAVEMPERVRGIIMAGPSLEVRPPSFFERAALGIGMHGPWKVRFWEYFYRSLYPKRRPDDLDEYCRLLRSNLAEPGRFAAQRAFLYASKQECVARIPRLTRPVLVTMGDSDPDYSNPAETARDYAKQLRGEVVVLESSGHYPHVDSPSATASAIMEWMKTVQQLQENENGASGS